MSASEKLQFIISGNADSAIKAFRDVGKAADKELGQAETKLDKVGLKMTKFGAGAVAAAGVAAVGLFKVGQSASDLGESVNAVNVTFGAAAAGVLELGENAAKSVGLSKAEFNSLAVQFSSFADTVAGESGNVVGTLDELTTRTADFASVMNLDVPEAARIFQSALAGETEPIKKFGLDLSAAAVEAYAAASGIGEIGRQLTESEKVQARYGLLMQATSKNAGDFAATSGELANQQRILSAELKNLAAGIGQGVLPVMKTLTSTALAGVQAFTDLPGPIQKTVGSIATIGVGALALGGSLSFVIGQTIKMRDNFEKIGPKTGAGLVVLGTAAVATGLYMKKLHQESERMIADFNEISRATDEEALIRFRNEMFLLGVEGKSTDEAMKAFAVTNFEGAKKIRDLLEARVASGEATKAEIGLLAELKEAIVDEKAARVEAAQTAKEESAAITQLSKDKRDDKDASDEVAEATRRLSKDRRDDTSDAIDQARATDKAEAALRKMDTALAILKGHLSDRDAWSNMESALADLQAKVESGEATWDELATATDDAVESVANYIEQSALIPPEIKTQLYAALDDGKLQDVLRVVEAWKAGYQIPLYPHVVTSKGGPNPGAVIPIVGAFAEGGEVPGPRGKPQLAMVHGGETILPTHKANGVKAAGGGPVNITINAPTGNAADIERAVVTALKQYQQRGGRA